MKTFASVVALCLCLQFTAIPSAQSQSLTESEVLAYELMVESNAIKNMLTLMKDQLKLGFRKALAKKPKALSPEHVNKALSIVENTFEDNIQELIKPITKLYSDSFTED